jgi:hypothetical protein
MARGNKPKLIGGRQTTVNLEARHYEYLEKHGLEKSDFYRRYIDSCIANESSEIDQLKLEITEDEVRIQYELNALQQKKLRLQELLDKELLKENEKQKAIELATRRDEIFESKYKVLIRYKEICEIDYYKNAKRDLDFENIFDTANWLLMKYSEININGKSYSESKIKNFLRYDEKNLARSW